MSVQQASTVPTNRPLNREDRFLHLKRIDVSFHSGRPQSKIKIKLSDASLKRKSSEFQETDTLHWECDVYVRASTSPLLTVQKPRHGVHPSGDVLAECSLNFKLVESADSKSFEQKASGITVKIVLGNTRSASDVTRLLANDATMAFATKVEMLEKFDRVKTYLDLAVETGKAATELYPALKVIVPAISKAFERLKKITDCHRELKLIVDDVASVLPSIEMAFNRVATENIRDVVNQYFEIIRRLSDNIIRVYSSSTAHFWIRNYRRPLLDVINDLKRRMTDLKSALQITLAVDTHNEVSKIHRHQLTAEDERNLERLKPPRYSLYDLSRCCLEGTRKSVIQDVVSWASSTSDSSRIFWLHGVAGCGKSSVASSVCSTLEKQNIPSYSFFCKRDDPERQSAVRVIQALAYFLAKAIAPYRAALAQKLKENLNILDRPLPNQIDPLFFDHEVELSDPATPVSFIVVLDALDECNDNETVSELLLRLVTIAPCIKFIITSRPLPGIGKKLQSSQTLTTSINLFDISAEEDILAYTRHRFENDEKLDDLRGFVTLIEIEELAQKALCLFIWIAVVCSYISDWKSGRQKLVRVILQTAGEPDSEKRLDKLYLQVLKHAVGSENLDANKDDVRLVVGLISASSRNKPLPSDALFAFGRSKFPGSSVEWDGILQDLRSVLPVDTETHAIRACHKSFLDFLGDRSRSKEFWTDSQKLDTMMAETCLEIMLDGLKFNICDLKSSSCRNNDAKDLRIDEHIPRQLQYSCLYWVDHLEKCGEALTSQESFREMLRKLICQEMSLYWLEAMSLLSELRGAIIALHKLASMLKVLHDDDKLHAFTTDLYNYMEAFYEPMSISAPHICISALVWAPSESLIAKSTGPTFKSRACLIDGRDRLWSTNTQTLLLESEVNCVAYSPDGRFIVSGCNDNSIRILDTYTGAPVGKPLQGHEDVVWSVKYSPDGRRIVSGSWDKTIRIWDAKTGAPVGKPLQGHESAVFSVKYSPDGRRIVSGSLDETIRIWDAEVDISCVPLSQPVSKSKYCPDEECFMPTLSAAQMPDPGTTARFCIPPHVPSDGWIRTVDDGLLLWIPLKHRRNVCDMSLMCISRNPDEGPVRIDWKRLCYGTDWSFIKRDDQDGV